MVLGILNTTIGILVLDKWLNQPISIIKKFMLAVGYINTQVGIILIMNYFLN